MDFFLGVKVFTPQFFGFFFFYASAITSFVYSVFHHKTNELFFDTVIIFILILYFKYLLSSLPEIKGINGSSITRNWLF